MVELTSRMSEELDYDAEARNQRAFARAFRDDPDYAVPDVLAHSPHVIVSEWLEGVPLSRIIAEGDAQTRDAAAQLYFEFLLAGPVRAGLLHADPHPGNFRLTPDGRLGVLDFGAVKHLPNGLPPAMGELLTLALSGDATATEVGLRAEGFIKPRIDVDAEDLLRYLSPFVEPIRSEEFVFTRSWLRGISAHINDVRRPEFTVGMKLNLPPEYLLIHRVWLGGIGVLCQLGGTVQAREAMTRYLPGFDPGPALASA